MNTHALPRSPPLSPRLWLSNKPEIPFQQYTPTTLETKEQLKGQVTAIVTGGGSGAGLMVTQALIANGARVYVLEPREETLRMLVNTYNTGAGQIIPSLADTSNKEEVERIIKQVSGLEPHGIQLLVNSISQAIEPEPATQDGLKEPTTISLTS